MVVNSSTENVHITIAVYVLRVYGSGTIKVPFNSMLDPGCTRAVEILPPRNIRGIEVSSKDVHITIAVYIL